MQLEDVNDGLGGNQIRVKRLVMNAEKNKVFEACSWLSLARFEDEARVLGNVGNCSVVLKGNCWGHRKS